MRQHPNVTGGLELELNGRLEWRITNLSNYKIVKKRFNLILKEGFGSI